MAETKDLKIVITSDSKDAQHDIEQFGNSMGGISPMGIALGNILADIAEKALNLGKTLITSTISAFEESERMTTQLDAVLKSTGGTIGMTRDQLLDLSKEIQNNTTISDESALAVENMALTFTNIHKEVFPNFVKATIDTAYAMNSGLKPSASQLADTTKQLGKALQDPESGLGALHRVGVNVDELKEKFKTVTDTASRQKLIIKELMTEFGGSGAAQLNTFAGKIDWVKNKINDLMEVIGRIITQALNPLLKALSPLLIALDGVINHGKQWSDVIGQLNKLIPNFGTAIQVIWQLLQAKMAPIMKELKDLWDKHHESITLLAKTLAVVFFAAVIATIEIAAKLIDTIIKATDIILSFGEAFHKFSLMVKDAMSATLGYIKEMVNGAIGLINKLIEGFNSIAGKVPGANKNTIGKIPALAQGTDYFEGGMALVGERGAELVTLPKGSSVTPANETAKMMGQTTVNIYNPVVRSDNDIQSIVQQIKQVLGRQDELARLRAI